MPPGFIQLPPDSTGKKLVTHDAGTAGHVQHVTLAPAFNLTYQGRANTFRTPGRAGTAGQRLASIYNAAASPVLVNVNRINIDLYQTVVKAITVPPPIIRVSRFTSIHTGGTTLAQVAQDTALTTSASVTTLQDASADGTSGTALAVTIPAGQTITQEFAPRYVTAVGYEMADRIGFLEGEPDVLLRAGQGLVIHLDYTAANMNPVTDMWIVTIDWDEYTT